MSGRIHAGKRIKPGGRYDRFLKLLSANPKGASTLEIVRGAGVCAVNSIAAELRAMGYDIECEPAGVSADGGKIYRYRWLKNLKQIEEWAGEAAVKTYLRNGSAVQGTLFDTGEIADPREAIS